MVQHRKGDSGIDKRLQILVDQRGGCPLTPEDAQMLEIEGLDARLLGRSGVRFWKKGGEIALRAKSAECNR